MRDRKKTLLAASSSVALVALLVGALAMPAAAAGTITTINPLCGVVGSPVTLTGIGFTGTTGVTFPGGISQPATPSSDTTIVTIVPALSTGAAQLIPTPGVASGPIFTVVTAAAPTVTGISPTSGAVGSTVTITGTNLCGTSSVRFSNGALAASSFTVLNNNQLTAVVPPGAVTGYVTVQNTVSSANSGIFTVTGTGVPTITSFTPTSGPVGTIVSITGSNFTGATSVRFNGVSATTFTVNSSTLITATVPSSATTGPIQVSTPGGTASSSTSFTVTGGGGGGGSHGRSVSLNYSGHKASGQVNVSDGFAACRKFVPVYFQQKQQGGWQTIDTTATNGKGKYNTYVPDKSGKFRAQVKKLTLVDGSVCGADSSPVEKN